jgi:hypothetical protein
LLADSDISPVPCPAKYSQRERIIIVFLNKRGMVVKAHYYESQNGRLGLSTAVGPVVPSNGNGTKSDGRDL